jgi:hypothetical protein
MAIRARWPEKVTPEMVRKGQTALEQWGAALSGATEL